MLELLGGETTTTGLQETNRSISRMVSENTRISSCMDNAPYSGDISMREDAAVGEWLCPCCGYVNPQEVRVAFKTNCQRCGKVKRTPEVARNLVSDRKSVV